MVAEENSLCRVGNEFQDSDFQSECFPCEISNCPRTRLPLSFYCPRFAHKNQMLNSQATLFGKKAFENIQLIFGAAQLQRQRNFNGGCLVREIKIKSKVCFFAHSKLTVVMTKKIGNHL